MKEYINLVKEFHEAFGVENAFSPTILPQNEYDLRFDLGKEELIEYYQACLSSDKTNTNNSITSIADALGDQLYILFGTILRHGLQDKIEEIFREIHRSNMSKLDPNGKPIYREDGKVLKSELYSRPDISSIING